MATTVNHAGSHPSKKINNHGEMYTSLWSDQVEILINPV